MRGSAGLIAFFRGTCLITVRGTAPEEAINRMAAANLPFWEPKLSPEDPMVMTVRVLRKDVQRALKLCERAMCDGEITAVYGLRQQLYGLKKRPVLLAGLALCLLAVLILPQFIWTIEVSGCQTLHEEEILRALEELGVGFGTYGPSIQPQKLKYQMLERFPQLEWLTVNRTGGRAEVLVRERLETPAIADRTAVSNLVAASDGLIVSMDVLRGKAVAAVGQTVLAGELLVTGVQDQTTGVQLSDASAEIYAMTRRHITAVTPTEKLEKTASGETEKTVFLILGKKRIKIWGNSGISLTSCDKMITEYSLTLPGGLSLPVTLEVVLAAPYQTGAAETDADSAAALLESAVRETALAAMTAGEITALRGTTKASAGRYELAATLNCREEISRRVAVEFKIGE